MKNIGRKAVLFFAVIAIIGSSSCHKYKLDNAMTDIARDWQLIKYELNGGDSTVYYSTFVSNYTISFTADGFYTESYTYFGTPTIAGGAFNFQSTLSELVLSDEDTTRVYEIIELNPQHLTIQLLNTFDDKDVFYLEPY